MACRCAQTIHAKVLVSTGHVPAPSIVSQGSIARVVAVLIIEKLESLVSTLMNVVGSACVYSIIRKAIWGHVLHTLALNLGITTHGSESTIISEAI
jgi:hypothetical protein